MLTIGPIYGLTHTFMLVSVTSRWSLLVLRKLRVQLVLAVAALALDMSFVQIQIDRVLVYTG